MDGRCSNGQRQISWTRDGAITRLVIAGEIDVADEGLLQRTLSSILDERPGVIEVDMSRLTFLSAEALGQIANVAEIIPVKVLGADHFVRRLATILGVTHLLADS